MNETFSLERTMTSNPMTLAPPAERRAAIDALHGTWIPRTLAQHLDAMVELFADEPFIITDDQTWTYRQITGLVGPAGRWPLRDGYSQG